MGTTVATSAMSRNLLMKRDLLISIVNGVEKKFDVNLTSLSLLNYVPYVQLCPTYAMLPAVVLHVRRSLRVVVPHVLHALRTPVSHAQCAPVLHLPSALRVIMLHVPPTLHPLLLNTMISNLYQRNIIIMVFFISDINLHDPLIYVNLTTLVHQSASITKPGL